MLQYLIRNVSSVFLNCCKSQLDNVSSILFGVYMLHTIFHLFCT
uniref:Uncharacterized protein n=1 Tax=Setaria italica TaxID=4555 RepID=K3ZP83_SETIT